VLLTALYPICDLRPLLGTSPGRLSRPEWPEPQVDSEFIPWFGAVRAGGRNARLRGERVCRAAHAMRLLSWPAAGASGQAGAGPFRVVFRDLRADGDVLARFDLALGTRPESPARYPEPAEMAERFVRTLVEVPQQRPGQPIELCHAGSLLARAYLEATTPLLERSQLGPDWVVAGDPVFFVQWASTEGLARMSRPRLRPIESEALSVGREALLAAGPRASVWYLQHAADPGCARRANEVRAGIADLWARRECLRIVLERIAAGRLSPPSNAPEERRPPGEITAVKGAPALGSRSDVVQTYLNGAVREIERRQRKVPVSTGQLRGPDDSGAAAGEPGTLWTALDDAMKRLDLRGNIRRNVTAWVSRDWEDAGAGPVGGPVPPPAPCVLESFVVKPQPLGPVVRLDDMMFGVSPDDAPAMDLTLHATLGAVGREMIEPGEKVAFLLSLRLDAPLADPGPAGAFGVFGVHFDQGIETRRLFVTVEAQDFLRPEGERWEKAFTLRRDGLSEASMSLSFVAQAVGDRSVYGLAVHLVVDGAPAGRLDVQLARRGAGTLTRANARATLACPGGAAGADLVVSILQEGESVVVKWSAGQDEPGRWPLHFDTTQHFNALGNKSYQQRRPLHEYCRKLASDMDRDLFAALKKQAAAGSTVLVMSQTPMLPFELVPLGRNDPFLGTQCAIARWVNRRDVPMQAAGSLKIARVACIRPEYPAARALPSAMDEENDLRAWARELVHVGDRAELAALLDRTDVDLLHFAGHAEDNPPGMAFSSKERIDPSEFWDTPLAKRRPFFFVNGCRAGMSHAGLPPSLGGMIESLLSYDFAGVVAPFISVDSGAARTAARAFYEAVRAGRSVAQAVQAIHACAESDPDQAATYLSYLAYVPPGLRLTE
jgi:hypothetical protein